MDALGKKEGYSFEMYFNMNIRKSLPIITTSTFLFLSSIFLSIAATLPTWIVLEFSNESVNKEFSYGKYASDAFIKELVQTGRYETVSQETLGRIFAELDLRLPLINENQIGRLGASLNALTVITGTLKKTDMVLDKRGKRAEVILEALVNDVASGKVVNGAEVRATSSYAAPGSTDPMLLKEAIQQAAFQVVRTIVDRALPEATIQNTLMGSAMMNYGIRQGYEKGWEVIVHRGTFLVAYAVIDHIDPTSGMIRIIKDFGGVRPGDKVRPVRSVVKLQEENLLEK